MVQPARCISCRIHVVPGPLVIAEIFFEVPLDHSDPSAGTLTLFARAATRHDAANVKADFSEYSHADFNEVFHHQWLLYLEGGPGYGNKEPQNLSLTRPLLNKGCYQLLFLDYRGTGNSTPVTAASLVAKGSPQVQADYLKHFRADSIVEDCEAVRLALTAPFEGERKKWSIFGQSYGGFVSLTYLSRYPDSLRESYITGGLAPIGKTAADVYTATYRKVMERNEVYFKKFPEDAETLHQVALFLKEQPGGKLPLPGGGFLTFPRVLVLGQGLGMHGGLDIIHAMVLKMKADLMTVGELTRLTLRNLEDFISLDGCPIHAVMHESIYCNGPGVVSGWAAEAVGKQLNQFEWLHEPVNPVDILNKQCFFSGEMIYPFLFDTYPELMCLKETANILAAYDGWGELYDEEQLARNKVPVYALSYVDDMYVDFDLAQEAASKVGNIKVCTTNTLYHNAIRARPEETLGLLARLREDTID